MKMATITRMSRHRFSNPKQTEGLERPCVLCLTKGLRWPSTPTCLWQQRALALRQLGLNGAVDDLPCSKSRRGSCPSSKTPRTTVMSWDPATDSPTHVVRNASSMWEIDRPWELRPHAARQCCRPRPARSILLQALHSTEAMNKITMSMPSRRAHYSEPAVLRRGNLWNLL